MGTRGRKHQQVQELKLQVVFGADQGNSSGAGDRCTEACCVLTHWSAQSPLGNSMGVGSVLGWGCRLAVF